MVESASNTSTAISGRATTVTLLPDGPARMVPKPPGAADTLPEAGEKPTDLPPPRRGPRVTPGGAPPGPVGRERSGSSCSMTSITAPHQPTGTLSRRDLADI